MTQDELADFVAALPGVDVLVASEARGAPAVAWGDSFFYYDPARDTPADQRMPFATVVTGDYPGFDKASWLDREGVFRVNIAVGRRRFADLLGYPPEAHAEHSAVVDHSELDAVIPHPVYAAQGWVSVLNPGTRTSDTVRELLFDAHGRAADRHRPRAADAHIR